MALELTLNQLSVIFKVKLIDCISDVPFLLTDIATVAIVFVRTDGTTFSKVGTLEDDPENAEQKFIQYRNIPPETSILDMIGSWTYQGAGTLNNGGEFKTSERAIMWVVP